MLARQRQRGDTIVEVLFAVVIFSMVAVAAMGIMNRGTSIAQRSLELTLVRQQIDAQAEALRFIHHAYITAHGDDIEPNSAAAEWMRLVDRSPGGGITNLNLLKSQASTFGGGCDIIPQPSFIMNARTGRVHTSGGITSMSASGSRPFSQVVYQDAIETNQASDNISDMGSAVDSVHGIWIEAVTEGAGGASLNAEDTRSIDFHIRACWYSPASSAPSTIGTIVRLYDPRD